MFEEKNTDKKCFCGGIIVERSHIPYIPRERSDVYGPGSENVATELDRLVDGYHCSSCGTSYYKPIGIGKLEKNCNCTNKDSLCK